MNSLIETLDQCGSNFLSFAWPMLWQSSLLIGAVLAFDWTFRRKLRASIRYALWLVVLVKLCVPPTLALPTSPAWWLNRPQPPVAAKPQAHYTVTYDTTPLMEMPLTPLPEFVPPPPVLTNTAWLLLASAAVSSLLLVWLLVRWWQVTRLVRCSTTSDRLVALAAEAQKLVGLHFPVPVKLTPNSMSPAVCGLFRPAILIPQALAENFSDEQLRAVLLHELIHLRRRDVWLNFLQSLLQIVYWWHPLVWLANARLRRVREEAVDDAVMLALRDEAESYAPTLLEVAKLALNRPLASLGLMGILESRHALRQRIERLVDFRPPRQAGLTLVSLLGILAFTAVAVPMGDGPARADKPVVSEVAAAAVPPAAPKANSPAIVITAAIYQLRDAEFDAVVAGLKLNPAEAGGDPWWSAAPEKFRRLNANLKAVGLQPITRPRIQTSSGMPAMMYVGDGTNGIEFDCTPLLAGGRIDLTIAGKVSGPQPTGLGTNQFSASTSVENFGGLVIRTKNLNGSSESNIVVIAGIQLVPNLVTGAAAPKNVTSKNLKAMTFKLEKPVGQAELKEKLLAAGVQLPSIVFFYTDSGILFVRAADDQLALVERVVLQLNGYSASGVAAISKNFKPPESVSAVTDEKAAQLFMRTFSLDTNNIFANLQQAIGSTGAVNNFTNTSQAMLKLFGIVGIDLNSPPGKSVYFNETRGKLFVKATEANLDMIERVIQTLNHQPMAEPDGISPLASVPGAALSVAKVTGVLTNPDFAVVLRALEQRSGAESLAEPEVTTTSGRGRNQIAMPNISVPLSNAYSETSAQGMATNSAEAKAMAGRLVQDGKLFYEMGKRGEAESKLKAALGLDPENAAAKYYVGLMQTNGAKLTYTGPGRQEIVKKLQAIRLERVAFDAVPLGEVLRYLTKEAKQHDPDQRGINFIVNPHRDESAMPPVQDPLTGLPQKNEPAPELPASDLISLPITLNRPLTNVSLGDVLDAVVLVAPQPIRYSVQDFAIVFSPGKPGTPFFAKVFQVDANVFVNSLLGETSQQVNLPSGVTPAFKELCTKAGVDWESPAGKSVFFNDRLGRLFVRATEPDLAIVERVIEKLNSAPPQLHIKARFYEVPKGTMQGMQSFPMLSNSVAGPLTGILTRANAQAAMRALEARPGFESLAEPEVTTSSGRQTQMRVTQVVTVITNLAFYKKFTNKDGLVTSNSIVPQTSTVETGPMLDVVPYILSDGHTINLALIPTMLEFLGYDQSTNTTAAYDQAGEKIDVPTVLPRFRTRQAVATVNLWDDQTAMLRLEPTTLKDLNKIAGIPTISPLLRLGQFLQSQDNEKTNPPKEILVFVTATIVDPAGNRVHTDDDLPFAQTGVPPQPSQPTQPPLSK